MSSPPIEDVACNEEVVATTTNNSSPPDNGAQGKSPEIPTNLTNSEDNCAPDPENRGHSAEKKRKFISPKELFGPPVDKIAKKTDEQPVRKKRKCGKTMIMTDTPTRKEILQAVAARTSKKPATGRKEIKRKLFERTEKDGISSESESEGKLILDSESFPFLERTPLEGDFVLVSLNSPSARSKSTVIFFCCQGN